MYSDTNVKKSKFDLEKEIKPGQGKCGEEIRRPWEREKNEKEIVNSPAQFYSA